MTPKPLQNFPGQNVVIPVTVLEELDKMKRLLAMGKNSAPYSAISALNTLGSENLCRRHIENQAIVRIQVELRMTIHNFALSNNGNKIHLAALFLKDKGENVVFVSKDFGLASKQKPLGLKKKITRNLKYSDDSMYKVRRIETTKHDIDVFYKEVSIKIPGEDLKPNEYCILSSPEHSSAVGKYDPKRGVVEHLLKVNNLWGIKPLNVEQRCAVDALLRDDIKLVTLIGKAGTGKIY